MTTEKTKIASELLEQALRLYYEGGADFAALHLAGAAEELLGNQLDELGANWKGEERLKPKSAYRRHKEDIARLSAHLDEDGKGLSPNEVGIRLRAARNAVKHLDASMPWGLTLKPRDEARDVLYRAVENYGALSTELGGLPITPLIRRFLEDINGTRG